MSTRLEIIILDKLREIVNCRITYQLSINLKQLYLVDEYIQDDICNRLRSETGVKKTKKTEELGPNLSSSETQQFYESLSCLGTTTRKAFAVTQLRLSWTTLITVAHGL